MKKEVNKAKNKPNLLMNIIFAFLILCLFAINLIYFYNVAKVGAPAVFRVNEYPQFFGNTSISLLAHVFFVLNPSSTNQTTTIPSAAKPSEGLFDKNEYATSPDSRFTMKLTGERCLVCSM